SDPNCHSEAVTRIVKLPLVSVKAIATRLLLDCAAMKTPGNPMALLAASTILPVMLFVALIIVRFVVTVWPLPSVRTGGLMKLLTYLLRKATSVYVPAGAIIV